MRISLSPFRERCAEVQYRAAPGGLGAWVLDQQMAFLASSEENLRPGGNFLSNLIHLLTR